MTEVKMVRPRDGSSHGGSDFFSDQIELVTRMEMVYQEGSIQHSKAAFGSACRCAVSVRDSRVGHMEMFLPQV